MEIKTYDYVSNDVSDSGTVQEIRATLANSALALQATKTKIVIKGLNDDSTR